MILVLNVYKPRGLNLYGWRKQNQPVSDVRQPRSYTPTIRRLRLPTPTPFQSHAIPGTGVGHLSADGGRRQSPQALSDAEDRIDGTEPEDCSTRLLHTLTLFSWSPAMPTSRSPRRQGIPTPGGVVGEKDPSTRVQRSSTTADAVAETPLDIPVEWKVYVWGSRSCWRWLDDRPIDSGGERGA